MVFGVNPGNECICEVHNVHLLGKTFLKGYDFGKL